jgi:hypothetical protein
VPKVFHERPLDESVPRRFTNRHIGAGVSAAKSRIDTTEEPFSLDRVEKKEKGGSLAFSEYFDAVYVGYVVESLLD